MVPRTRFAPSPTGSLHVGGARTALYCWLYAKKGGGQFVLRIEDTDQVRSTDAATRGIVRDLRWLGLTWDEGPEVGGPFGPYLQSERLDTYGPVVASLVASGHAYEAWETRDELAALREAGGGVGFVYRRRSLSDEQIAAFKAEGRTPVVRLAVPDRAFVVQDAILGEVVVHGSEMEDLVIQKADGFPTYHLAVVVDDQLMGITQVLRGQEHLKNTHKHEAIASALGWALPRVGHLPLIFNPQGQKMSKREKARTARTAGRKEGVVALAEKTGLSVELLTPFLNNETDAIPIAEAIAAALGVDLPMIEVMDFRRAGYLPEALLNYLALLGWSPGGDRELLSLDAMLELFSLDRVGNTSARFDPEKLRWMNGEYVKLLPFERIAAAARSWLEVCEGSPLAALSSEALDGLLRLFAGRYVTFSDLERQARPLLTRPGSWDKAARDKHLRKGDGAATLARAAEVLAAAPSWDAASLEAHVTAWSEAAGLGLGKIAQPLRVALTGTAVSPPIFDTLAYVGRDEAAIRISALLAAEAAG